MQKLNLNRQVKERPSNKVQNRSNLSERLLDFAAKIILLAARLDRTAVGRHLAGQLTRSGTSSGANYEEACGAESRPDFVHKLQIVLKELKECLYWLRLIKKTSLVPDNDAELSAVLQEAEELAKIIARSVVTAKTNQ